jgi:hypothetical protein
MAGPNNVSISSTLFVAFFLLLAPVPSLAAMAAWWTDRGPNVAVQDPKTGRILHSACNSNNTPIFPTDNPHYFRLNNEPRNGTAIAAAGWWNSRFTVVSSQNFFFFSLFFPFFLVLSSSLCLGGI